MTFGFYNTSDTEQEVYENKKTEEFIRRFSEKMNGKVNCRDILRRDISIPDEMAEIRKNGLILKKCTSALEASIEILEDMTAEYITYKADVSIDSEDFPENDDIQTMVKRMGVPSDFAAMFPRFLVLPTRSLLYSLIYAALRSSTIFTVKNSEMRYWIISSVH